MGGIEAFDSAGVIRNHRLGGFPALGLANLFRFNMGTLKLQGGRLISPAVLRMWGIGALGEILNLIRQRLGAAVQALSLKAIARD